VIYREVPERARSVFADMAYGWGYPRKIQDEEIEAGTWIMALECPGSDAVGLAWFTPGPTQTPPSVSLHAIGLPGHGMIGTDRNLHALQVIAGLMGADRLYAILQPSDIPAGVPVGAMRRYLRMRGWHEDDWGAYCEIGAS
jgi:hypothetical protein